MESTSTANKRIAKNTLMLYIRMLLTMAVTLYTSRVVLNVLGVEDYGIYNVVGGVVMMFAFFNGAMSSSVQRFLSYEIGRKDYLRLKQIFNVAQIIHIGIALLIFILAETVGLWFLKSYLVIPNERMASAIFVYHFSILSFIVTIVQVPYNATIIAHEKMNVYAYVSVLDVVLRLLIVFMLSWLSFDKLKLYGVLYFIVSALIALVYRIYTLRNFESSKFMIVKDRGIYKTLLSYSGWSLMGNIAAVGKGQGVSIILNLFFGPVVNAARAVAMQVQSAVQSFVYNIQVAVNPQIIKSFALNEKEYMESLIIRSSKLSFYLIYLISLPIILEVNQILTLWLKIVPNYAPIFTVLILIIVLIDSVSGSLITAVQATGKIKTYQIVIGILFLLIIPVSYLFLNNGFSPEITLYINIVVSIIALFFRLFLLQKMIDFPVRRFVNEIILRNIFIIIITLGVPLYIRNLMEPDYLRLFIVIVVSVIWNIVIVYLIGFTKVEKLFLTRSISKVVDKSKNIVSNNK